MDSYIQSVSDESMSLDPDSILPYCIGAFESYDSLLSEFMDRDDVDYEIVLYKIIDCSNMIINLLKFNNGDYIKMKLLRLQNNLQLFYGEIVKRKTVADFGETSNPIILSSGSKPSEPPNSKLLIEVENTIQKPKVTGFSDLAGLYEAKQIVHTMIILPKRQPQLFEDGKPNNRLLLYGPPGTGKTLLVHAIAAEMGGAFYGISASDVFSPFVGESEKMLKLLFKHAKESNEYAIIFIDEIDAFCRKRNTSEPEHSRRSKTEIMCQMSAIENCSNIFIICATNCPWDLDTAILRRFQKRVFISLPDRNERLDLLQFYTRNMRLNLLGLSDWDEILNLTEGLSSSDLETLCQNATVIPIMELQGTQVWRRTIDNFYEPADRDDDPLNVRLMNFNELPNNSARARPMKISDLIEEAKKFIRTVSVEDLLKYEYFNKK